jgi:hypothetical protein
LQRRGDLLEQGAVKEEDRRWHWGRNRGTTWTGTGVKGNGGGAVLCALVWQRSARGGELEVGDEVRGKKDKLTLLPYLYPRSRGCGRGSSVPLPRPFLIMLPRVGTSWGGGSNHHATMQLWQWRQAMITLWTITWCDRSQWQSSCKFQGKLSDLAFSRKLQLCAGAIKLRIWPIRNIFGTGRDNF